MMMIRMEGWGGVGGLGIVVGGRQRDDGVRRWGRCGLVARRRG